MGRTLLAGVAMVKTGRILLVHPTGAPEDATWSIPKGHQEPGEPTLTAALREVEEETGIRLPRHSLEGMPLILEPSPKRMLFYWVVNATWLPIPDVLPMEHLQLSEVDEARFVPTLDAEMLIEPWQMPIINHIPRR